MGPLQTNCKLTTYSRSMIFRLLQKKKNCKICSSVIVVVHKQTESGFHYYPGAKVLFKRRKKPPQWACITARARLSPTTKAASPLDARGHRSSTALLWGSAQHGPPRNPCNSSSSTSRAAVCKLLAPRAGTRWDERQETSKPYQNRRYHVCYH